MKEKDEISIQFVFIPDEGIHGRLVESNNYYCVVEYSEFGILHREIFDEDDVIYLDEISIPIYQEGEGD